MRNTFKKFRLGFTLVELMMSISIVSVITLVVLWDYGTFLDNLALSSASQELVGAIRQAQVYGLSVKEVVPGGGAFNYAYGINFDKSDPSHYVLFVDTNTEPNMVYDVGAGCDAGIGSTECLQQNVLRDGVVISSVSNTFCGAPSLQAVNITFLRPSPDAQINATNSFGSIVCSSQVEGKVVLQSPKGRTQTITIQSTGQISIK